MKPVAKPLKLLKQDQFQNLYVDDEGGVHGIGLQRNAHGDLEGLWYLGDKGRVYLKQSDLVHVQTLAARPAKGHPKAKVWTDKRNCREYLVTFNALGEKVEKVFYAPDKKTAGNKAVFWAAKEFDLDIAYLHTFVNDVHHPLQVKEIRKITMEPEDDGEF